MPLPPLSNYHIYIYVESCRSSPSVFIYYIKPRLLAAAQRLASTLGGRLLLNILYIFKRIAKLRPPTGQPLRGSCGGKGGTQQERKINKSFWEQRVWFNV